MAWLLSCADLAAAGLHDTAHCCNSCHTWDEEWGSEMLDADPPPNGRRQDRRTSLRYCCRVEVGLTRQVFAQALWAHRAALWHDVETPA